ncbi:MAG: TOBE domain-containing protein, partial [Clostridiales bacterium]|jgi:spermidine/putrescine transport system ATP-binding protein|nr:TOBE domain-containing protein [Clostridiales bacterium]
MPTDYCVEILGARFRCLDSGFLPGESVDAVIRPEDIDIVPASEGAIRGIVKTLTFKGVHYEMTIEANGFSWLVHSTDKSDEGSTVGLALEPDAIHVMKAQKSEVRA